MDLEVGNRVRIDIPDETDPDHVHHGKHGSVKQVISDDAGQVTGKEEDSKIIRVELENGETLDFRPIDLRPPIE